MSGIPADRTDLINVHLRILVIEDSNNDYVIVKRALSKARFLSFECVRATCIEEVFPLLAKEEIDLVLADLTLPDSDWLETVTKLKQAARKIPIVVMTGLDDERLALQILRAGAQDYLIKSKIGTYELVRSIRYAIERKALMVELQDALENVRTLSGLLPICASCKKIRDDKGYWATVESYLAHHSGAQFTHGLCPECAQNFLKAAEQPPRNRPQSSE
jgi:DNA-binding response OmpR family regulator